jgi:serine/threonine-protein kinase
MPRHDEETAARARARLGAVLQQKYRLDKLLGIGGMAVVYSATHLRNANRVAVKVLHPELSSDAGLRARFLREGYMANSVDHRGTVRVLDDDTAEDGSVFLVMELLDGETLEARWERNDRRLGLREVIHLMTDLLDVLTAAHAKGIVHRDVKPENLFLTRDGTLKVLDFGIARVRQASSDHTRTGDVFGTPNFMPPEQALGRSADVDALSDLWSVGATAFALLSGRFVHVGRNVQEMIIRSATRPAPPLETVVPEAPPVLCAVVDRALAFAKADRWPSAAEMREALLVAERAIRTDFVPEGLDPAEEDDKTRLALDMAPASLPRMPVKPPGATLPMPTLKRKGPRTSPGMVQALAFAAGGLGAGIVLAVLVLLARKHDPPRAATVRAAAVDAGPASSSR